MRKGRRTPDAGRRGGDVGFQGGASLVEYAVLLAAVGAALVLMSDYVRNAFNANAKALQEELNGATEDTVAPSSVGGGTGGGGDTGGGGGDGGGDGGGPFVP
jgi:Flp pilus assembly pilin Flp